MKSRYSSGLRPNATTTSPLTSAFPATAWEATASATWSMAHAASGQHWREPSTASAGACSPSSRPSRRHLTAASAISARPRRRRRSRSSQTLNPSANIDFAHEPLSLCASSRNSPQLGLRGAPGSQEQRGAHLPERLRCPFPLSDIITRLTLLLF